MTISKWTKAKILEAIEEESEEKLGIVRNLTASELKEYFLRRTAYHHTGAFYSATDFYEIDMEYLMSFTREDSEDIILSRKPRQKRSKEVIEAEKRQNEERKAEKAEKERLFKYQNKCKTLRGFMRSKTIDIDKLRKIRIDKINEKRQQLRNTWTKQGLFDRISLLDDDAFVESYIK